MTKKQFNQTLFYLLIACAGLLLLVAFTPSLVSILPRDMSFNRAEAERIGEKYLQMWGYTPADYDVQTTFEIRKDLLRHIELQFKPEERADALKQLPVYYWQVRWRRPEDYRPAPGIISGRFPENYREIVVQFDHHGGPVAFWIDQDEDTLQASLSDSAARAMADSVLQARFGEKAGRYELARTRNSLLSEHIEHHFSYTYSELAAGLQQHVNIRVTGQRISKFALQYNPATTAQDEKTHAIEMIPLFLLMALLTIICIIVLIRRLRIDAVNFQYAAVPAAIIALSTMVMINIDNSRPDIIFLIIGTLLSSGVTALAMGVAAATGESILRQVASDKLLTLDALYHGRVRHRIMAQALLRGLSLGIGLAGFVTLIIKLTSVFHPVSLVDWCAHLTKEANTIPFLYSMVLVSAEVLWWQFAVLLVLVPLFLRSTQKFLWITTPIGFIIAASLQNQVSYPSDPLGLTLAITFVMGIYFTAIFLRFDFITALVTHFTFAIILSAMRLCAIHQSTFVLSGWLLLAMPLGLLLFAAWAWRVPKSMDELRNYLPRQAVKIIENDRLKRELEIAQRVQLSFLPKSNPQIEGLEIASICIPANEVGGDYYDFIKLDAHRLGFAIGDVSGKGISAAFYMTLTKGFLRSLSRMKWSPREVLTEINTLFYESVDRGHFISLVFGIIDLKKRTISFARAGHTPLIWQRRDNERFEHLSPPGIALGLEPGDVFKEIIKEQTIKIESGDRFILYTDGFSEAMNPISGEFGEERLEQAIRRNASIPAKELLQKIIAQVQHFVGQHPQHDDMTMVIIRVL